MSVVDKFQFVADITSATGALLGQLIVTPDWDAGMQSAHFSAVRQGRRPPLQRCSSATVEPIWDPERGAPRIRAVQIVLDADDGDPMRLEVPRSYFRDAVELAAARLVAEGKLLPGERFFYDLSAFPQPEPHRDRARRADTPFAVEEIPQPLPLASASLDSFLREARPIDRDVWWQGDNPVFIPAGVIAEATRLARLAKDVETGGLLIGRLFRDTQSDEVFSVTTAFIAAEHTQAERTRLTFTPDTWATADAALQLRHRAELLTGWSHSHPDFCAGCPEQRRRVCPLARPFLSRDDIALHRTVFPGPYHVALLLSDLGGDDLVCQVYGWRQGIVVQRGYYLIEDSAIGGIGASAREPDIRPAGSSRRVRAADRSPAQANVPDAEHRLLAGEPPTGVPPREGRADTSIDESPVAVPADANRGCRPQSVRPGNDDSAR